MKKRLLKPPDQDGELFLRPSQKKILSCLSLYRDALLAHQPYFFNPGVSLKFLFLEYLPAEKKEIIFLDIDRVKLKVNIPLEGGVKTFNFIETEEILEEYPRPSSEVFESFFLLLEENVKASLFRRKEEILKRLDLFKNIILSKKKKFLKEVLAESFLEFYGLKKDYSFFSELLSSKEFREFFFRIYKDSRRFEGLFNQVLEDYRKEFRFRYRNFPFPRLKEEELPFWIVYGRRRYPAFKKDLSFQNLKKVKILPRASTLTLFLRLYRRGLFIHGIGGANYEWVGDRLIERFFRENLPLYAVVSGTFLIDDYPLREFPYFFFEPQLLRRKLKEFLDLTYIGVDLIKRRKDPCNYSGFREDSG